MAGLYAGRATFSLPTGDTVEADVDLWVDDNEPLVVWGGTAEADRPGVLWRDGQQVASLRFGDRDGGYRVGECMILAVDPDAPRERVTLRGSGDLSEVDPES